jgi:hypothetical protein
LEEEGTKSLEMRRTGTKPKDLSKKEKKEDSGTETKSSFQI